MHWQVQWPSRIPRKFMLEPTLVWLPTLLALHQERLLLMLAVCMQLFIFSLVCFFSYVNAEWRMYMNAKLKYYRGWQIFGNPMGHAIPAGFSRDGSKLYLWSWIRMVQNKKFMGADVSDIILKEKEKHGEMCSHFSCSSPPKSERDGGGTHFEQE